jgi:hypothetical protein
MKKLSIVLLLALYIYARAYSQTNVPYRELNERSGLPSFFYKLHHADSIKIVYFGGSITDANSGWRDQSTDWIKAEYPGCKIQQKNASLPGTGSDFGAFRTEKDVISSKPDLVFVEFAVNDDGHQPENISRSMEGIVRKIRRSLPYCEICFVYTVSYAMDSILREGKLPVSASTMETVADHYGITSIFMAAGIIKFANDGKLVWKGKIEENPGKFVFGPDGVHPYSQTGHKLYTEAVSQSLKKLDKMSGLIKHKLIKPLNPDNYEEATMIPVSEIIKNDPDWEYLQKGDAVFDRFSSKLPLLAKSKNDNATITIRFRGSKIGLLDITGPSSCNVNIGVNGSFPKLHERFDQWCSWYRINYLIVDEIKKADEYTVVFKVSDEKFNKKEVLLRNPDNKGIELNDEYQNYYCYAAYILLIGNIIK